MKHRIGINARNVEPNDCAQPYKKDCLNQDRKND